MTGREPGRDPGAALAQLVEVVARLRGPGGCPWDRAQTHQTLVPFLLEEAYEAAAAVDGGSADEMRDELGDVLLQVLLHAQIESEGGRFGVGEVADSLREKLIRRHPHVFGGDGAETAGHVRLRWEEIKAQEGRPARDRVVPSLVAASKFVELQEASGQPVPTGVWVREPGGEGRPEDAIGDILVEVVALARRLGCDPELCLHQRLGGGDGG